MTFKSRLFRLCLILLGLFLLLFFARLIYGYYAYPDGLSADTRMREPSLMDSSYVGKRNYAGSQYMIAGQPGAVDQKYEKVASLLAETAQFTEDEERTRAAISAYNAIIQFENGRGTQGNRSLSLAIGVQPDSFDALSAELKGIGVLRSMEVSKTDTTNEFLDLKAKRISLEKTRAALMDLRSLGGNIDELMKLQNRILEIEEELQSLGVALGDFDEVNAFCTVRFSLYEHIPAGGSAISLSHRVRVALFWAAEVYLGLMAILCLTTLAAFFTLLAIDRLNILRAIMTTLNDKKE